MSIRLTKRAAARAALFACTAITAAALQAATGAARPGTQTLRIEKSAGGSVEFTIEVAESAAEKAKGLMYRTKLGDSEGMLFPYGEGQEVTMWMHNTYIPLDMVFIRADGVIHRIEAQTEPLSDNIIASQGNVSAVLEIPGGAAGRHGLKPGDRVHHAIFETGQK